MGNLLANSAAKQFANKLGSKLQLWLCSDLVLTSVPWDLIRSGQLQVRQFTPGIRMHPGWVSSDHLWSDLASLLYMQINTYVICVCKDQIVLFLASLTIQMGPLSMCLCVGVRGRDGASGARRGWANQCTALRFYNELTFNSFEENLCQSELM